MESRYLWTNDGHIMQEDRVSDKSPALVICAAAVNAKALDQSSQLALARASLASITCPNVCGHGYVPYTCKRIYISAYCRSVYSYKCMRLLTRLYGT